MRKKLMTVFLVITLVVQLFVPAVMITCRYMEQHIAEENGEMFTFSVTQMSYYNSSFHFRMILNTRNNYLVPEVFTDGIAYFKSYDEKPDTDTYIDCSMRDYRTSEYGVSFPDIYIVTDDYRNLEFVEFMRHHYYEDEKSGYVYYDECLVEAYVYKGKLFVSAVYIDGVDAKEYLSNLNENYDGSFSVL